MNEAGEWGEIYVARYLREKGYDIAFVGVEKQRKLALTAASFASRQKFDCPIRFDVAEVYFPEANNYKVYKINYIIDAFRV